MDYPSALRDFPADDSPECYELFSNFQILSDAMMLIKPIRHRLRFFCFFNTKPKTLSPQANLTWLVPRIHQKTKYAEQVKIWGMFEHVVLSCKITTKYSYQLRFWGTNLAEKLQDLQAACTLDGSQRLSKTFLDWNQRQFVCCMDLHSSLVMQNEKTSS